MGLVVGAPLAVFASATAPKNKAAIAKIMQCLLLTIPDIGVRGRLAAPFSLATRRKVLGFGNCTSPFFGGHMLRRKFITLFGGVAATWPLAASAQQPTMPVIGFSAVQHLKRCASMSSHFTEAWPTQDLLRAATWQSSTDGRRFTTIGCILWLRIWFVVRWP